MAWFYPLSLLPELDNNTQLHGEIFSRFFWKMPKDSSMQNSDLRHPISISIFQVKSRKLFNVHRHRSFKPYSGRSIKSQSRAGSTNSGHFTQPRACSSAQDFSTIMSDYLDAKSAFIFLPSGHLQQNFILIILAFSCESFFCHLGVDDDPRSLILKQK